MNQNHVLADYLDPFFDLVGGKFAAMGHHLQTQVADALARAAPAQGVAFEQVEVDVKLLEPTFHLTHQLLHGRHGAMAVEKKGIPFYFTKFQVQLRRIDEQFEQVGDDVLAMRNIHFVDKLGETGNVRNHQETFLLRSCQFHPPRVGIISTLPEERPVTKTILAPGPVRRRQQTAPGGGRASQGRTGVAGIFRSGRESAGLTGAGQSETMATAPPAERTLRRSGEETAR
ncbi:MAG: hypothetical protein V3S29_00835 [bacterium]